MIKSRHLYEANEYISSARYLYSTRLTDPPSAPFPFPSRSGAEARERPACFAFARVVANDEAATKILEDESEHSVDECFPH